MAKLPLLFIVVLLVELWILLWIGSLIGFWPTVGLELGTALLGASLAKLEGRRVLSAWRDAMSRGQPPDEGLTSGILVLVGGALLVAPGLLTDVVGLSLLFPPVRRRVAAAVRARLERRLPTSGAAFGNVVGGNAMHDLDEEAPASGARGGVQWSVRVVQIGAFERPRPAGDDAGAWRAPREVIDVEAERVIEEDAEPRRPARLPP